MSDSNLLRCVNLSKSYSRERTIIRNVSLDLKKEECIAILGPSGCGKSTLLRMIAGFETLDQGNIELDGVTIANSSFSLPPEKRKLGMVFQEIALFPHLTIGKNIAFGLQKDSAFKAKRVHQMLELVGLPGIESKMPHMLSGGEQQRVAIARALASAPKMILFDEPFNSLDYKLRVQMRKDILEILHNEKVSTVLVTHDQDEAFVFADRMIVLYDGKIIQEGTPQEIYHAPATAWIASFVGSANFLPWEIASHYLNAESKHYFENQTLFSTHQVMIRPENITISLAKDQQTGARIRQVEFLGDRQMVEVELREKRLIRVQVSSASRWQLGSLVNIQFHTQVMFSP